MARAYITITIATLLRNDYPWISTEAAEQLGLDDEQHAQFFMGGVRV
jgi:hypothetical protein